MSLPEFRPLTIAEVEAVRGHEDPAQLETAMLAYGCGVSEKEAAAWRSRMPAGVVETMVRLVMRLSGL